MYLDKLCILSSHDQDKSWEWQCIAQTCCTDICQTISD